MLGKHVLADAVHEFEAVFKDPPTGWSRASLDRLFEVAASLRRAVEQIGTDEEPDALSRVRMLALHMSDTVRVDEEGAKESAAGSEGAAPERGTDESTGTRDAGPESGDRDRAGIESAGPEAAGAEAAGPEGAGPEGAGPEVAGPPAATTSARSSGQSSADGEAPAAEEAPREPEPEGPSSEPEPEPEPAAGEVVRVPFAGLDALLTRVGELVTLETRVERLLAENRRELDAVGLRRTLEDAAEGLTRITSFLHETTMELRLVPVRRVFERFPSVVRDLARQSGKQIRVKMEGEDVQIDKGTADAVSEPLLHLVRNAVDHGFDTNGNSSGTVTLSAERLGDRVRFAVEDDGKGLDRAGILARARQTGVIGPDEKLDEDEVADLIFRPGFSTREEATTVSGRGVGLDVVQRKASALRGTLAVESGPAGGTRFVMDLPLTLAIVPAVLFVAAGETLAIPSADVEETLREVTIRRAGGAEVVNHRDEVIPVARPARLFEWGDGRDSPPAPERFALVVRRGDRRAAVLASRLLDQRDVVVKALPAYLGPQRAVSGAAVTHEADVVLVLDVGGLLDLNLAAHRKEKRGG